MKIYLAGKWEEHDAIAKYATELRAEGHEITHPWFEEPFLQLPKEKAAEEDVLGVIQAEVVIFVFEKPLAYSGALTELGIAIGTFNTIIIVGHGADRNIFAGHLLEPRIWRVETWKDAKTILANSALI